MVVNDKGNGFCLVLLGKATACRAHSFFSRLNRAANPCVHQTGNGPREPAQPLARPAAQHGEQADPCRGVLLMSADSWLTAALTERPLLPHFARSFVTTARNVARADHCRADEPVRWSQSSDLGEPLVFPAPAVVLLTNNCYRRLRRPFAARSLRRQCCRAGMRSSRALDAAPRHRARVCVLPRCAERWGPPRRRQPTVAVLVGRR